MRRTALFLACALLGLAWAGASTPAVSEDDFTPTGGKVPNLVGDIGRPLRYRPDNGDFVIDNGTEFFNRSLYGGDTAFRVESGDKPEFLLYLPGRGGNLRFGLTGPAGTKWLQDAAQIETRYRPGELIYEVRDPLLGSGALRLEVLAYAETEGLIVRAQASGAPAGVDLVWAYGGINGKKGVRDGDIGTETVPISQYFQLQPDMAKGNQVAIQPSGFTDSAPQGVVTGLTSAPAQITTADANQWSNLSALLNSRAADEPIVIGRMPLPSQPAYLSLQRTPGQGASAEVTPVFTAADLPAKFTAAQAHFDALRGQVKIDTPDPYINAAMGALNVAAEATWDDASQDVMHGAIAWRTKLLGWRGPYWPDALGEFDRADIHFRNWAKGQNVSPIPASLPPPDTASNLARSEAALHSNGALSNNHYDMNAVYIDALFRHLEWTGDLKLARDLWPVIQRDLAWEKRLFRRTYGPDHLPLYEAYAQIWASDGLYYNGGGVAYASAYNEYHNRMAARVAALIGEDPKPYADEASAIDRAMRTYLWQARDGDFAEYKDLLGVQLVHPDAGLWTYYHTIDSQAVTRQEAWRLGASVQRLPFIPVTGPGVPSDANYGLYSTTDWLPYNWSINNMVTQEDLHMALALWEAGRSDQAFTLAKSGFLASMFMGISPGNLGSLNYLDVDRRESQRDFADSAGVTSRMMVEGLFGLRPDALNGQLVIQPGFPDAWTHASITHPAVAYSFQRDGDVDAWSVKPSSAQFKTIKLRLAAPREGVASVEVNGEAHAWRPVADAVGRPVIEINLPGGQASDVRIRWSGAKVTPSTASGAGGFVRVTRGGLSWLQPLGGKPPAPAPKAVAVSTAKGVMAPIDMASAFNDRVANIFAKGKYLSPRSPYVSLTLPSQGVGSWAGEVNELPVIDDSGLRQRAASNGGVVTTPQGVPFRTPGAAGANNIAFTSLWDNYPHAATVALSGHALRAHLLMAGTTNPMQSRMDNGEVVATYTDGTTSRLALNNPANWWPIEQDLFLDDYQFRDDAPPPERVDLKTGNIRTLSMPAFKGKGGAVDGGAASVLDLPLNPNKTLQSLTVRTTANDVVIGLMAVTLERPSSGSRR